MHILVIFNNYQGDLLKDGSLFEEFKWRKRILVILGDDVTKSKQKIILDPVREGLLERDLIIFGLDSEEYPYYQINKDQKESLTEHFSLNRDDNILLIGKDGTVKGKWGKPVSAKEIFDLIDSMPMRKAEMRRS